MAPPGHRSVVRARCPHICASAYETSRRPRAGPRSPCVPRPPNNNIMTGGKPGIAEVLTAFPLPQQRVYGSRHGGSSQPCHSPLPPPLAKTFHHHHLQGSCAPKHLPIPGTRKVSPPCRWLSLEQAFVMQPSTRLSPVRCRAFTPTAHP